MPFIYRICLLSCILLFSIGQAAAIGSSSEEQRRISIGSKLFPSVISVDKKLSDKVDPKSKTLVLAFVYLDQANEFRSHVEKLKQKLKTIRKIPIKIIMLPLKDLQQNEPPYVSAIFIANHFNDNELKWLLAFAKKHHIMTFSPFSGDVQRGVAVGLYIGSRILPLVNIPVTKSHDLHFHPMFLNLARHHE